MSKRAHCLLHVPFEGLANIETWLNHADYDITYSCLYNDDTLPNDISDIDLIFIMGGPMSVHDEAQYPWLENEKSWLKRAIASNKPMLGICLGAQLIANVLGASVYLNTNKEIGWFELHGINQGNTDVFNFPESFDALHWHGETFDLPNGASHLAQNKACINQAFQYKNAIGLQFHLEMNSQSINTIIEYCSHELLEVSPYIQSEHDIRLLTKKLDSSSTLEHVLQYLDTQTKFSKQLN